MSSPANKGKVYLVGAGPGDPGLITVRGAELLKYADCIIYDKLANPVLLRKANPGAEFIHVPKRVGKGSFTQEQIDNLMLEKAGAGKMVVRLKGGDPCIFGRGAEEAAILAKAGIPFEIVPGITAGIAACEYAGIMPTDRKHSSQLIFLTGREALGKKESNIDWDLLAKFRGTIVFYMGMGNLDNIAERLISHGMSRDTPVAVVADATTGNQKLVKGSIADIAQICAAQGIRPPGMIIIGTMATPDDGLNWFMSMRLFGKTVVATRDEAGNAVFAEKILRCGACPVEFATINLRPLTNSSEFIRTVAGIKDFDWIVFTSPNGVSFFFDYLREHRADARAFGSAKIAAIGSKTADRLADFGIRADFVPGMFTSEELGKRLAAYADLRNRNVLLLRSALAWRRLKDILEKAGAMVAEAAVYTSLPETKNCDWLRDKIADDKIDWITFASPSAVQNFFTQIDAGIVNKSQTKIATIGPVTSARLEKFSVAVDIQAEEHTIDGLVAAIEGSYK